MDLTEFTLPYLVLGIGLLQYQRDYDNLSGQLPNIGIYLLWVVAWPMLLVLYLTGTFFEWLGTLGPEQ